MNHFLISQKAESDLEDIWVYLAKQNEIVADQQIAKIFDKFPMLAQFPNMGRQRDDLAIGVRSFPIKPYIIFYKYSSNQLEIIRVLHQSRDMKNQF
ncbi:type II toxin-antitoxin system RelE/ParE family toxin [Spirulina sp. CS-785/01]|uniref:type II toxin-antitoxin system RelE/ParE family toxin n=1 Tax=Spirulina sp. CS-785/01 TaxID=3021716 RepID=UPI0023311B91|nr:type II toxin-antitoxin system RelE/ParE family toxin [Spirulina sp. CS-785/01]MDB9311886.1 type II toxin-antitoxin system RelE/ParE family toxin [Spirulina sp. CS-785/01]